MGFVSRPDDWPLHDRSDPSVSKSSCKRFLAAMADGPMERKLSNLIRLFNISVLVPFVAMPLAPFVVMPFAPSSKARSPPIRLSCYISLHDKYGVVLRTYNVFAS